MEKRMLTPTEVAEATIKAGIKKANLSSMQMILLGIFAGMFIGFGSHAYITVIQTLGNIDTGFAKFMGAAVFPVGLMLVLIAGGELFTGNNLMTLALKDKKITLKKMLKNWCLVYIGNFIGSIILALVISKIGLYNSGAAITEKAIAIAQGKVGLSFEVAFFRGILCNIIVVLAVWISYAAKDITGKIFAVWFPVMMFVLSGFEHSIANMFFLSLGKLLGGNLSWGEICTNNLLPVTLGNILGGAVIVPVVYYICYVQPAKSNLNVKEIKM